MAVAGDIVIELKIDDSGMPVVVKRAGAVLREFQGTLNQTARSVKRLEDNSDSLSTRFRHLVMTMGNLRFVAMDINDLFLRLPTSILKSAGELERMQVLMTGLSKETNKAAKAAEGMRGFNFVTGMAKTAPFEIAALSDAFVKMKTAGIDPTNGSLNALVNSVARFGGTSESLKRASVAIQQMSGKGVVSMEELRQQLGEAVPSAMQDMADGMGVSMAKLAKIVETGTLEATPAINKMLLQMQINNEGAAAEMMKTWGGTLSRLKSEWELTAKFVTDNGLGNAAKEAANSVSGMLRSDEFKRFAGDSGAALGSGVQSLVGIARTMMEFRREIALATQAWIAYKIVFSVIAPLSRTLEAGYLRSSAALKRESAEVMNNARNKANAVRSEVADERTRLEIKQLTLSQTLALHEKELASVRVRNAAILAEDARLNAQLKAMKLVEMRTGANNIGQQQGTMRDLDETSRKNSELTARQILLTQAVKDGSAAIATNNAALAKKTAEMHKLGAVTSLQTAATLAATGAVRLFSGAMALVGGPIGVAIMAIMGLVWWYNRAAAAAEESAARQRRANSNTSSKEDLAGYEESISDAKKSLSKLQKKSKSGFVQGVDGVGRTKDAADRAKDAKLIIDAEKKIASLEQGKKLASRSVSEQNSREFTDTINMGVDREILTRKEGTQKVIDQLDDDKRKKLEGMKKTDKQYQDAVNASNAAKQKALVSGLKAQIAAEGGAIENLDKQAKSAAGDAKVGIERAASIRRAKREEIEANLANIEQTIATNPEYKDKNKSGGGGGKGAGTGPVHNKIENFINDLKQKESKLNALLPGLLSTIGKSNEVVAALDELEAKFATGEFDYKKTTGKGEAKKTTTVGPTSGQKKTMRELVERNAQLTELQSDASKLSGEINKMMPDFQHALRQFTDPEGTGEFKRVNKFDELIARLKSAPDEFKKFTDGTTLAGASFEQLLEKIESGRTAAATIDAGGYYVGMVDENRKLSLDLIENDRERARKQAEIAETLAAKRANIVIEEFTKAKVATSLIDQYKAEVEANAVLRASDLARKTRSPIEKLADDWQKSMTKMDDASAQWAGSFVDMIVSSAKTGKLEFGSFVQSVLADILKIQLQRSLGDPLKEIVSAGTNWLKTKAPDLGNDGRFTAKSLTPGVSADYPSADSAAISGLASAAALAKDGLGDFVNDGVDAATKGLVSSIATQGQQALATGSFASSIATATSAVYSFIAAMQGQSASSGGGGFISSIASMFGASGSSAGAASASSGTMAELASMGVFADGGIMSNIGPVSLRKYAAGGIANSPQLALYGEGSMSEAYVPLPDGRSIPVTLGGNIGTGAPAAPSVTVNVINQTGQHVAAQQGQPRFDGKQMILDVVLSAASQPGSFRDGLKGAIR